MLDPAKIDRSSGQEAWADYLDRIQSAMIDGMRAAQAVVEGRPPNVGVLTEYAAAMAALHVETAQKRVSFDWIEPTDDDVENARRLVQLAREGAQHDALLEPAQRAARVVTDAWDLERFHAALYCLQDDTFQAQHRGEIQEAIRLTVALFERGCRVAGFVPAADDVARLRRLHEVAREDGAEAREERRRLVLALEARLPPHSNVAVTDREDIPDLLHLWR
jgi:hypothetical protein